jgi:hypothetical protein
LDSDPDPLVRGMDLRIRIRIRTKMSLQNCASKRRLQKKERGKREGTHCQNEKPILQNIIVKMNLREAEI